MRAAAMLVIAALGSTASAGIMVLDQLAGGWVFSVNGRRALVYHRGTVLKSYY